MKAQEIKAHQIGAQIVYQTDPPASLRDAIIYEANLADFGYDYCETFILCAIDDICAAHKRQRPLDEDERKSLAKRIYRNKKHYTLGDIQLFPQMLIDCKLGDALKSVDAASIMEKLKEYDRLRSNIEAGLRRHSSCKSDNKPAEATHQVSPEEWERLYKRISLPLTDEQLAFRKAWGDENVKQYGLKLEGKPNNYDARVRKGWWLAWMESFLNNKLDDMDDTTLIKKSARNARPAD